MLVLVRCFSYAPHVVFVMSLSYSPDDTFSKVFLLVITLMMLVLGGVSLALLMILLVKCFSYTPHASFSEVFLLHTSC